MLDLALQLAHGDAMWIGLDALHQNSAWCCSIEDCGPLPAGAVLPTPDGGYMVLETGQKFQPIGVAEPYTAYAREPGVDDPGTQDGPVRTYLSIDHQFWACAYGGAPSIGSYFRCLFVPVSG